eukprot:Plantae.Rhodophyta-Purpureofilum_apyrenoidigerum.ctg19102.p1 GENE.Plantae.Rhodophyta-Purpureofilum_apyrenoidigerum.ctg19102~~Plantae.Rhodophyta-Purpureofilum_apyrenoidigerum.ctg19102.p1  ORF type:complete len:286 (-),score=42.15 Plantae.Rhodophyta-Purpureofilum_apyrenoidigerum.ctg19102:157-1014(-)
MAKMYTDLGRTANRILDDGYTEGKHAKFIAKEVDGSEFTATSGISDSGPTASLGYRFVRTGYEIACKVLSDGSLRADTLINRLHDQLKLKLSAVYAAKSGLSGTAGFLYKKKHFSSALQLAANDGVVSNGNITLLYEGVSLGVATGYDFSSSKREKSTATLCYTDGMESEVSVSISDQPRVIKGTYHHCVSRDFEVAAEADYNIEDHSRVITMGTKFCVDPTLTVKAKFNSIGLIAASFEQKLHPNVAIALSTRMNVTEFERGHKFGITVQYESSDPSVSSLDVR